jgi:short subunit fatty acids transporter
MIRPSGFSGSLKEARTGMESFIEQIFKEFPFGIAVAMVVFLSILLIIWLLLPLWVLFIQWNTAKIKDEIRNLVDQLQERDWDEKGEEISEPED